MQIKAYNETWLRNQAVQQQARYWCSEKLLTQSQVKQVEEQFPDPLYRPNGWIKVGLFFFTCLAASFATGLTSVFTVAIFSETLGGGFVSLTYAALYYAAALFLIREKKLYHSGVDNALVYGAIGWVLAGFGLMFNHFADFQVLPYSCVVLVVLGVLAIRHADWLLTAGAVGCLVWIINYTLAQYGVGRLLLPFVNMALGAGLYFLKKKTFENDRYFYWAGCLKVVEVLALVLFYVAGNYAVVREGNALLNGTSGQIAFSWLFYAFTALTPVLYVWQGLRQKDRLLLVLGLLGIGCSIATYKFYFGFLSPELSITLGGAVLMAVAWACIRYLKTPKHGYTFAEDQAAPDSFDAEAMVIAQTLGKSAQSEQGLQFGGGDFGGGGAGDKY